jgi:hypothetical protein
MYTNMSLSIFLTIKGQFYQHFWHQSRATFAQISAFLMATAFAENVPKMALGANVMT